MRNNYVNTINQNKAKNKVDKRNRVLALILLGLFVFWSICSVFGVLAYIENRREDNSSTVYADEVSQYFDYSGSNFMVTCSSFYRFGEAIASGSYGLPHMVTFDFQKIDSDSVDVIFDIRLQVLPAYPLSAYNMNRVNGGYPDLIDNVGFTLPKNINYGIHFGFNPDLYPSAYNSYTNFLCNAVFFCSPTFNGDINSVRFYSSTVNNFPFSLSVPDGVVYSNIVRYTCSNGSYLEIKFYFFPHLSTTSAAVNDLWTDRTYYLNPFSINVGGDSSNSVTNAIDEAYWTGHKEGNQSGYQSGYVEGEKIGYDNGYDKGFNDAYNSSSNVFYNNGYNDGYSEGYDTGVQEYNDYTFLGLMSAVVDAPLQALTGVLDFEILGVNLSGLFFGILTTALGIFVLRLIFG